MVVKPWRGETKAMPVISRIRFWLTVVVGLAFAMGALADPPAAARRGNPRVYRTQAFRLKNFDAEKAKELLEELLADPIDVLGPEKPGPGGPNPAGPDRPPLGLTPGPGGQGIVVGGAIDPVGITPYPKLPPAPGSRPGGGFQGGGVGGLAGGRPNLPAFNDPNAGLRYRLILDERSKSLLMRGPETDVLIASEFIGVLELPRDKPLPANLIAIRAFRLREADPEKVAENLLALGHKVTIVAVPSLDLVVATGPDAELKEIAEAVKTLDGGEKGDTEAQPAKPKGPRKPVPEEEDGKRKPGPLR